MVDTIDALEKRRLAAKNALYALHGYGHIMKTAEAIGVRYQTLRLMLGGHHTSEPMLRKVEEYIASLA